MTSNVSIFATRFLMPTLNYSSVIIHTASKVINVTEITEENKVVPERNTPKGSAAVISICFAALLLNIIEIGLLLRKIKRITIFEIWLLNLATADKIVSVFMLILESIRLVTGEETLGIAFASVRKATETIVHFSVYSSSCILLVIAIDRFVAVKFPFKHRLLVTKKKAVIIMLMTWFVNITISLLGSFSNSKAFAILDSGVIILMSLLFLVTYTLIIHSTVAARRRSISQKHCRGLESGVKEVEVIATCVLVVISYQICMLPYAIATMCCDNSKDMPLYVFFMMYCNSITNPLVYFFKGILGRKLKQKQNQINGSNSRDVNSKTGSSQLALKQDSNAGESRL
eukprot:Seg169.5 transcript_id=Seg169.5/GoldUCD/mRNA.D3Y31 product="Beta-2 adrenergic receptor" protein_id=Seg169.5/GoldUCD/D3Y31